MRKRAIENQGEEDNGRRRRTSEHRSEDAAAKVADAARSKSRPSESNAPKPLTRQGLKDWTRKRVSEEQAAVKRRKRDDEQSHRIQRLSEGKVEGKDNDKAQGRLGEPYRMLAGSTRTSQSRNLETNALDRILRAGRAEPRQSGSRGRVDLE